MSWGIGTGDGGRDIGYGVPAECDHPDCNRRIDRGLSYLCGGPEYDSGKGCGLYFCGTHLAGFQPTLCVRCRARRKPFTPKPDVFAWVYHKMTHPSWRAWRREQMKLEEGATK